MIRILAVGKIKEDFLRDAISEYLKRLSRFTKIEIIEVKDYPAKDNESLAEDEQVKNLEGAELLSHLKSGYTIVLDPKGMMLDSIAFSNKMSQIYNSGISDINFVIGGSLGLSKAVKETADYSLSFSLMTFPHQLFRLILLEQVYRAYKIMRNEPYNK